MVQLMGLDWRTRRNTMTWKDWMQNIRPFVFQFCKQWDLPICIFGDAAVTQPQQQIDYTHSFCGESTKEKLTFRSEMPDSDEVMETAVRIIDWGHPRQCLIFVTDSQILQGVVCGHSSLNNIVYEQLISRIDHRLFVFFKHQWTPPQLLHDLVQWLSRKHNKVADRLADLTMDRRQTWTKTFNTELD